MNTDRISSRARLLSHFANALLLMIPIGVVIALATGSITAESMRMTYGIRVVPEVPGLASLLIWPAVEGIKVILLLWIIWCVRAWLIGCAQGAVFSGRTARRIQQIGIGLAVLGAAHILSHTITVLALTWDNPPGERALSVGFGSTELFLFLAAGLMTLFGWIQSEAARLAAEIDDFV